MIPTVTSEGPGFAKSLASVRLDDGEPPFLIMTLPARSLSEDEFRAYLEELNQFANRAQGAPFGFVIDTRGAPDPDAARRRAIAEYWDDCLRHHGHSFVGAAIVMSSSTGRAVFKAILWLRNNPLFLVPVATPQEGLQRLRAEIGKLPRTT
jgi:hypothetical protein